MKDGEVSVIVVDDDETFLKAMQRMLSGARSFASFRSSSGFLSGAELEWCDIVFMDVNIPGGPDGITLTRRIKDLAPQCDVVVMTGAATVDNAMGAIKAGAYDFLTKPFSFEQLEAAVDRCVEKRRISSELKLLKVAQGELSAAYSQLKSSERMKEAFLSVIGHELRTPLTKIIGGVQLLRAGAGERREEVLGAVEQGARQLHETIESLILYADSRKEPAPGDCSEVDVNAEARSVGDELSAMAAKAGVALSVSEAPAGALVNGRADWIRGAIRSLAVNAIKFNRRGGGAAVSVTKGGGTVSVTVADTGIGIPGELLSGLGNPFYQVADYLTRKTGGLGLGLAVVKQVAEAHKGGMTVRSAPGKGTAFKITLKGSGACLEDRGRSPGV